MLQNLNNFLSNRELQIAADYTEKKKLLPKERGKRKRKLDSNVEFVSNCWKYKWFIKDVHLPATSYQLPVTSHQNFRLAEVKLISSNSAK